MTLKRKITAELIAWKRQLDRTPLIIQGIRRCGKTTSVLSFAREHYSQVIHVDFLKSPHFKTLFEEPVSVSHLVHQLAVRCVKEPKVTAGDTILIFDNLEACPRARETFKPFKDDGRFDVIGIRSRADTFEDLASTNINPIGAETILPMRPLDFEEFLWAFGAKENEIAELNTLVLEEKSIPLDDHESLCEMALEYAVVGGMPEAVTLALGDHPLGEIIALQKDILATCRDDITAHVTGKVQTKALALLEMLPRAMRQSSAEVMRTLGVRRYLYKDIANVLEAHGLIDRCQHLTKRELPLFAYAQPNDFKVFPSDTGLCHAILASQNECCSQPYTDQNYALLETLIANSRSKMSRPLYYGDKDDQVFWMRYMGKAVPLVLDMANITTMPPEIREHLNANPDGLVIRTNLDNIHRSGNILTLPLYLLFLLNKM